MKFINFFNVKKLKVHLFFTLAISLFMSGYMFGQNLERYLISNAGSEIEQSQLIIDFSLGETAVAYDYLPSVRISQGFHQGSELVSSIYSPKSPLYNFLVYPNPTNKRIHIENPEASNLNYEVLNNSGQIEMRGAFTEKIHTLNTSLLNEGIYILIISDSLKNYHSYKFIKI